MGMRMRWYASNGARVRVLCLTTGAPRPDGRAVRREECLNVGALLGVDHYTFSSIPDTRFVEHRGRINADLCSVFQVRVSSPLLILPPVLARSWCPITPTATDGTEDSTSIGVYPAR